MSACLWLMYLSILISMYVCLSNFKNGWDVPPSILPSFHSHIFLSSVLLSFSFFFVHFTFLLFSYSLTFRFVLVFHFQFVFLSFLLVPPSILPSYHPHSLLSLILSPLFHFLIIFLSFLFFSLTFHCPSFCLISSSFFSIHPVFYHSFPLTFSPKHKLNFPLSFFCLKFLYLGIQD